MIKLKSTNEIISCLISNIISQSQLKYEEKGFFKHIDGNVYIDNIEHNIKQRIVTPQDFKKYIFSKTKIDSFLKRYKFEYIVDNDCVTIMILTVLNSLEFSFILQPSTFDIMTEFPFDNKIIKEIIQTNDIPENIKINLMKVILKYDLNNIIKFAADNSN